MLNVKKDPSEKSVVHLYVVSRIPRFTKKEPVTNVYDMFFIILADILKQFKFQYKIVLDVLWLKVQAYNSWNTNFWFKHPSELIRYHVIVQHIFSCFTVRNCFKR